LRTGQQAEADTQIGKAERLGAPPRELADFYVARGQLLKGQSDNVGAIDSCRKALEYQCCHPPALALLARTQLDLGLDDDAAHTFDRYLETGEKPRADDYLGRGQARLRSGLYAGARDDFISALRFGPNSDVYAQLGWAYIYLEAWQPAIQEFDNALGSGG